MADLNLKGSTFFLIHSVEIKGPVVWSCPLFRVSLQCNLLLASDEMLEWKTCIRDSTRVSLLRVLWYKFSTNRDYTVAILLNCNENKLYLQYTLYTTTKQFQHILSL